MMLIIKIIANHYFFPTILYYTFLISVGRFVEQNGEILQFFG